MDGKFYDENEDEIEGTYVDFTKETAGYRGFLFVEDGTSYLVAKNWKIEAVTDDVVKGDVRFEVSLDKDGNVEMVKARPEALGASLEYNYDVYTPKGATTGKFVNTVKNETNEETGNVTTVTRNHDYYISIGTSQEVGHKITDGVLKDGNVVLGREYTCEVSDGITKTTSGYGISAADKFSMLSNTVKDLTTGKKVADVVQISSDAGVLYVTAFKGDDEIKYVLTDGKVTGKKVNGGSVVALDNNDNYSVEGVYDKPTSITEIVEAEQAKWIDNGLVVVKSDYILNSNSGEWKVRLNDIEDFDTSKVDSIEVTLKALDERFNGQIGGAIVLSSGNSSDNETYGWNSKEYWGVNDADKGFTAANKAVTFNKVGAYTYQGKATVGEGFAIIDAPDYADVVVQYWGSAYGLISVEGVVIKDKDGNVLVSYDDEGIITLPVTATAASGRKSVTVKWDKVPYAAKYTVETLNDDGVWVKVDEVTASSASDDAVKDDRSTTIKNLKKGTYTYRVVVTDKNDNIIATSKAVKAEVKVAIENLKAVCNSSRTVTLTWNKVEDATGYIVKSADGKTKYTAKSIKDNAYTVTGLTNGTQYGFKVYAYVDGEWISSDAVHKTPVGTPKNVKAACNASQSVTLTWDAVEGATGYIIKSADGKTKYTAKSIKDTTYTVTGLTNGTQYSFKVYAYTDGKWYASSARSKTPVGTPKNVKATSGSQEITLTWDKVAGATGYIIKSADGKIKYTAKSIKDTSYTVTGLTNGTQYSFKVYAYTDGKWYASSTKSKTPVGTPTNIKVSAASKQATISWNAVKGATGYIIKSADGKIKYTAKSIKDTSYTVTGLTNGTSYKFKVYAYTDGIWYAATSAAVTPTGKPTGVKAVAGSKQVTLSWNEVNGATGYIIKSADGKTKYTAKTIKDTSYTIKNLKGGTQYKFKVYAYVDGTWYASNVVSKTPKK